MGVQETNEAIRLIQKYPDLAEFVGGASSEAIARAEDRLGVDFPPSYQRFLEELGAGYFGEQILFGVDKDADIDVVQRTLEQRDMGNLPTTHMVVGPYGREAFFGFDCANRRDDGECPVAEFPREYDDIQEPRYRELDFGSFLLARVRDVLGEREQFQHP